MEFIMIGIIILGHGHFADGISDSLEILLGPTENYEKINYLPDDSLEDLNAKLEKAVECLSACNGLLVFTDIAGGTPFNRAIQLKMRSGRVMEVIGGTNVAAVLYGYMSRTNCESLSTLAEECISAGQGALLQFKETETPENSDDYEE